MAWEHCQPICASFVTELKVQNPNLDSESLWYFKILLLKDVHLSSLNMEMVLNK